MGKTGPQQVMKFRNSQMKIFGHEGCKIKKTLSNQNSNVYIHTYIILYQTNQQQSSRVSL